MSRLWYDIETFSTVPIAYGSHKYAERAEILLFAYAIDDAEPKVWDCTAGLIPEDLEDAIKSDCELWSHNGGMFDNVVIAHAMPYLFNFMHVERWRDTMVQALCHSLPASLGTLCNIFKLDADVAKDKRGKKLIQLFCKPTKTGRNDSNTHPLEWQEFIQYAASDITSMRAIAKQMPSWNYPDNKLELSLWHLDQKINMRGVKMDVALATKAVEAVTVAQAKLAASAVEQTNGEVGAATQRDKLLAFLQSVHGLVLPDLRGATVEKYLDRDDVIPAVRLLLETRLQASTSSVSKYKRVLAGANSDGRMRGMIQFSGASRTQRAAGRAFQPQNLMRPTMEHDAIEEAIAAFKCDAADLISDDVMTLASNCMRGVIIATPGKKLVVADLANIEGRAAAFLAGEAWKVKAFYEYDAGTGPDLYKLSYSKAFKVPVDEVTKDNRQVGKVMELAFSYASGVGGFSTFAGAYNMNLDELAEKVLSTLPQDVLAEAVNFYEWSIETKRVMPAMSINAFLVCEGLKRVWRRAHPGIVELWKALEDCAKEAITNRDVKVIVNEHLTFICTKNWLKLSLPSGDFLSYAAPKIENNAVTYLGMNQFTRQWERQKGYGGKFFENVCQKFARNVMYHNMHGIEYAGYRQILSVHDELITEAPDTDEYNAIGLSKLLSRNVIWTTGLPLAAEGFEAYRYRK